MGNIEFEYSFSDVYYCDEKNVIIKDLVIGNVDFGDVTFNVTNDYVYKMLFEDIKKNQEVRKEYKELSDEELFSEIQNHIQNRLDDIAREKNYDNGFTLASYSESSISLFKNDALKFIEYRDQCWIKCYELLNRYQNEEIERPTFCEVINSLPNFEW